MALTTPQWLAMPTALVWEPHGALSMFLALCGIGVGLSGLRDGLAAHTIGKQALRDRSEPHVSFSESERSFLITGATGFIGQRLVRAVLRDGHRVTVLTRQARQAAWMFDGRANCVSSMEQLPPSHQVDIVINLAGARMLGWRWTAARRAALRKSRIGLTHKVVDWIAAAEQKPAMMLPASAIGYYGTQERGDHTVLTESNGPKPMFMSDLCREWEQAAASHGVRVSRMGFGLVLGTQGALPMMLLPIKLGIGGPLGGGTQWLSWIHVDDVIGGIAQICRGGNAGIFNFTAPESLSQAQFSRVAATVLRRPYGFPTPGLPMRMMLGRAGRSATRRSARRPGTAKKHRFRFQISEPRRSAAQPHLGTSESTARH